MVTHTTQPTDKVSIGPRILAGFMVVFVLVSLPVVIRGAPLADDFSKCLEPQRVGLASSVASSFERLGAIRPTHVLEIALTTGVCQHLPFGFAIVVPLLLTLLVAWLLRGLLRDLGTDPPWPELGAVVWLLQPLGTEAALWPAALHIPLGLGLALAAVRLHRAGRHGWATAAVVSALLSVEQMLLALPFAIWLATPQERRDRAMKTTVPILVAVLAAFILWPGQDPRFQATVPERLTGLVSDPGFYARYPAIGLGLHSIPLAVLWAGVLGILALAAGALLGTWLGPRVFRARVADRDFIRRTLLAGLALALLMNVPVALAIPRQGSPRLFAPTWLVLSAVLASVGARVSLKKKALVGSLVGVLAAGAILSLALSVHVRLRSAAFVETTSRKLAAVVHDGDVVAVCGVRRTVVEGAPRGAFAVHDLVYEWAARDALEYYTGRSASFVLAGELWERPCPDQSTVDRVVRFSELIKDAA